MRRCQLFAAVSQSFFSYIVHFAHQPDAVQPYTWFWTRLVYPEIHAEEADEVTFSFPVWSVSLKSAQMLFIIFPAAGQLEDTVTEMLVNTSNSKRRILRFDKWKLFPCLWKVKVCGRSESWILKCYILPPYSCIIRASPQAPALARPPLRLAWTHIWTTSCYHE